MDLNINKSKKPRKSCLPQFSDEKIKSNEFLDSNLFFVLTKKLKINSFFFKDLVLLECFAEEFEEDF